MVRRGLLLGRIAILLIGSGRWRVPMGGGLLLFVFVRLRCLACFLL